MEPIDIFAQIQPIIKKEIDDAIQKYAQQSQFNAVDIPIHFHTGIESPQIDFSYLSGIPIISSLPADKPENGLVRLYENGATRRIYAFINGTWRYANLI